MKTHTLAACALAQLIGIVPLSAALTFAPGFSGTTYHHDPDGQIAGFDWGSDSALYYQTDIAYSFGGFHRAESGTRATLVAANPTTFAGGYVVAQGEAVHFNTSTLSGAQLITTFTVNGGGMVTRNIPNYALNLSGGSLLITSSPDWVNSELRLFASGLGSPGTSLGLLPANSGPTATDAAGNLYYAPGFGDLSIYRWSASELADALAGLAALEVAGHLWADYSAVYPAVGGATHLAIDDEGNLIASLTSFGGISHLVSFDDQATARTLVSSDGRLGDVKFHAGRLYFATGNDIVTLIPEPSSAMISLLVVTACLRRRRRFPTPLP